MVVVSIALVFAYLFLGAVSHAALKSSRRFSNETCGFLAAIWPVTWVLALGERCGKILSARAERRRAEYIRNLIGKTVRMVHDIKDSSGGSYTAGTPWRVVDGWGERILLTEGQRVDAELGMAPTSAHWQYGKGRSVWVCVTDVEPDPILSRPETPMLFGVPESGGYRGQPSKNATLTRDDTTDEERDSRSTRRERRSA